MAAKTRWHRYVTKLRHCHPIIRQITSDGQSRQHRKTHLFREKKSQRILTLDYCALYKYSYSLTYLPQTAGDVSHKPGGRLPLLSARPAVTLATLKRAATTFAAW